MESIRPKSWLIRTEESNWDANHGDVVQEKGTNQLFLFYRHPNSREYYFPLNILEDPNNHLLELKFPGLKKLIESATMYLSWADEES